MHARVCNVVVSVMISKEPIRLPCYRVVARAVRDSPPKASDIVSVGTPRESPSAHMDMEARRLAMLTLGYYDTPDRQASREDVWRTPPPPPPPVHQSTAPTHRPATCHPPPTATCSCVSAAASTSRGGATGSHAGSRAQCSVARPASQAPWVPPSPSASARTARPEHARQEPRPRPLELPTSAARNVQRGASHVQAAPQAQARPSSFRSRRREVAERKARAEGEVARLPPDRPTYSSSLKRGVHTEHTAEPMNKN